MENINIMDIFDLIELKNCIDKVYLDKLNMSNNSNDISGLLYFNDDYTGGMLEFPNQGLSIKPEIGSFIFFIGDQNKPHLVTEIESGSRDVYITFYEPVD